MRAPCSVALVEWDEDEVEAEISIDDVSSICRDDRCGRGGIHRAHPVRWRRDPREYPVDPLDDIVFSHVLTRECRTAGDIYGYVLNDYGTLDYRTLQRSLAYLSEQRKIIAVLPRNMRRRLVRVDDLNRPGGASSGGAYIRWDSPLLWTVEGVRCLAAQVEDLIQDRSRRHVRRRATAVSP